MSTDLEQIGPAAVRLRRRLPHAWRPFFGRFGNLTEVQTRTIPCVLAGNNVALCAPTASGKTEAVVAPVAELHIRDRWEGTAVLYVVPTRALGNDMVGRLEGPLAEMSLRCVLKHGDRQTLPEGDIDWLLTTPESLDSLLCRRPALFSNLRTVILDEIHLLDGTYRGDQLRVLLDRLRRHIGERPLTTHLLSATIADLPAVASRYTAQYSTLEIGGPRPIETHLVGSHEDVLRLAQQRGWRKLLCFCNRRRSVEETAGELAVLWRPYPVVAHHGSLDRAQREEAEEVMRHSPVAVCVATSTLEIGIDIGDIDLVVLAEPPWSLEALLQRVGRGSRRAGVIQAAAICHTDAERELLQVMFEAAVAGAYRSGAYEADLSVVVQQTLSLLFQHRSGISWNDLVPLLRALATPTAVKAIVHHLIKKGYNLELGDLLFPTGELLDLAERGTIHSNIPDTGEHEVVDADSGRSVGRIFGSFDDVFLLAGQSWHVLELHPGKVVVRRHSTPGRTPVFSPIPMHGHFHYLLPPDLQTSQ